MAQPSVARYFTTRKRSVIDEQKINTAKKVLILDRDTTPKILDAPSSAATTIHQVSGTEKIQTIEKAKIAQKKLEPVRSKTKKKVKEGEHHDIQHLLVNMAHGRPRCVTPPPASADTNQEQCKELKKISNKLIKSNRLTELRASIDRFRAHDARLKDTDKRIERIVQSVQSSPKLKEFKSIQLEVNQSPQKTITTPDKAYLSPKKEASSSVRRNLLNLLSPTKNAIATLPTSPSKQILDSKQAKGLTLPYKYRSLAEIFRSIETISQIMHNRGEKITFKKVKPAVEEMIKRNLTTKHLAQIRAILPEAYTFEWEKLRQYGAANKKEDWELVLNPILDETTITPNFLLKRKRDFYAKLIKTVKKYHKEFLESLIPPMHVNSKEITRWHAAFDLEKVPEIEPAELPPPPLTETFSSGQQVMEKAREMFHCNTRMEKALEMLYAKRATDNKAEPNAAESCSFVPLKAMKGIPAALLEKVRERQAAKALMAMTRSVEQEKQVESFARLPELARLLRNVFVTEKKSVLQLDLVLEKMGHSYRSWLSRSDMEKHLRLLAKEVGDWLVFHTVRGAVWVKLTRDADLSVVINKLELLAKEKNESLL